MSGHSKWTQIKRQKGVADARRGLIFTKLAREISVAARQGGGDPAVNFRLRLAIQRARDNNMPLENIDRAIKRATGEGEHVTLEEVIYEGYGPNGTAILIEVLTDNRHRTASELRQVFSRNGGTLGESGCVAWLFEQKGVITVATDAPHSEELALAAIDAGAEDVKVEDDGSVEVYTQPQALEQVRKTLGEHGVSVSSVEVSMHPASTIPLDEKAALQALRLLERLEELDDVQRVHSNAEFPNAVLEQAR